MTNNQKKQYEQADTLREIITELKGRKFKLDCGHHVTFGYYLGNDIVIKNGKELRLICQVCGY